jgi:hypothetical protein
MPNTTHSYLLARTALSTISFSGAVGTASIVLNGPGGQSGNIPLPRRGYVTALHVWDGTTHRYDMDEIAFSAGDRISVYCQTSGSVFIVKIRVNGTSTTLMVSDVPQNTTLNATVEILMIRE